MSNNLGNYLHSKIVVLVQGNYVSDHILSISWPLYFQVPRTQVARLDCYQCLRSNIDVGLRGLPQQIG